MMSTVCPILEKPPLSPSLKSLLSIPLSFRIRKKNFRFSAQKRLPFPPKRKTLFRRKSHLLSMPFIIRKGRESGKLYFPTTFSYEFQTSVFSFSRLESKTVSEFPAYRISHFRAGKKTKPLFFFFRENVFGSKTFFQHSFYGSLHSVGCPFLL